MKFENNILIIFLLAILFQSLILPFAWSTQEGAQDFQQGLQARDEGNYKDAEASFKRAIMFEPSNPDYRFELANLYAVLYDEFKSQDDEERAVRALEAGASELEQVVMARPDQIAPRFNLGVIYKRLGRYEDARVEFRKVLDMDPSSSQALMQIGSTYEDQGFYDEAESVYMEARDKNYGDPAPLAALEDLKRRQLEAGQNEVQNPSAFGQALNSYSQPSMFNQNNYGFQQENSQQAGLSQAIPYLGSLLVQQLMKGKNNSSQNTQS